MRVMTAVGARPQFIKVAPVSEALRRHGIEEIVVHSGQHYDHRMSQVFFEELGLPKPHVNLGVGSGSHGKQTALMLERFELAMIEQRPDWVITHGDTNSTLAAALAAAKLRIPLVHNEAGLRSFNRSMPEEHNRVLTDHCSDLLLCPTAGAVRQLAAEGIVEGVHQIGDVMFDATRMFAARAEQSSTIRQRLELTQKEYLLATLHRPYNVDVRERLAAILDAFAAAPVAVVLPCHPRLELQLRAHGLTVPKTVHLIEPVGYLDMIELERHARLIVTDSGGVQKEAYFHGVPCITIRPETEWTETVDAGWNCLTDADTARIVEAMQTRFWPDARPLLFGDGTAAERLVQLLE